MKIANIKAKVSETSMSKANASEGNISKINIIKIGKKVVISED